jgi:NAD(P)-dependent dehydrogenase (short-subunit alcohol dehydrogenase family)
MPYLSPPALGVTPTIADVAVAVAAFADPAQRGVTGATVVVDGGQIAINGELPPSDDGAGAPGPSR